MKYINVNIKKIINVFNILQCKLKTYQKYNKNFKIYLFYYISMNI
jgi:hypothetical protein